MNIRIALLIIALVTIVQLIVIIRLKIRINKLNEIQQNTITVKHLREKEIK